MDSKTDQTIDRFWDRSWKGSGPPESRRATLDPTVQGPRGDPFKGGVNASPPKISFSKAPLASPLGPTWPGLARLGFARPFWPGLAWPSSLKMSTAPRRDAHFQEIAFSTLAVFWQHFPFKIRPKKGTQYSFLIL